MERRFLMLSGVTSRNRHKATADISDSVMALGGWIVDHTLYSNIAIALRFALPEQAIVAFRQGIAEIGVRLDEESQARIAGLIERGVPGPDEITASLNVTFIHDEPDLRREVPAVPG